MPGFARAARSKGRLIDPRCGIGVGLISTSQMCAARSLVAGLIHSRQIGAAGVFAVVTDTFRDAMQGIVQGHDPVFA
jgi:hypothetical protein